MIVPRRSRCERVASDASRARLGARSARLSALTAGVVIAFVSAATPCAAATVIIHLKDSAGVDLPRYSVALFPTEKPLNAPPAGIPFRPPSALTDGSGIAVIQSVPPGAYAVYVSIPRGRGYLGFTIPGIPSPPWGDPQVPATRLTISTEEERVSLDVTVQRGDTVSCRLFVDRDSKPSGTVYMEEVATKVRYETTIRNGEGERLLPPGRWRVWMEPRAGQLLTSFEVDHEPILEGASAVIETKGEARRFDVDWSYAVPCVVTGRLAWDVGDGPPGTVVAHLVRAGGWLESVQRRGGTITDRIPGAYDKGFYSMSLLDGSWRLTVEGPRVLSSEPDHADLQLAPGDEARADFFVKARAEDGADRSMLMVKVVSPDGTQLSEAHVAVWRIGGDERGGGGENDGGGGSDGKGSSREPLMRAETNGDYYPVAKLIGLPAGSYRIVAGHAAYREGHVVFENFRGKQGDPQLATVTLRKGAEITATAKDENGAPARGIQLRAVRTSLPPPDELGDVEMQKTRALRSAVSDETGRMKIGGLDAGDYRLEAALTEQRKGTHFVRFEKAAAPGDPLETSLAEDEKVEIGLRLVPAASLSAKLACTDRGAFPEKIAVRVLPAPLDASAEDPGPRREGVFARDDLVLTGREKDTLFAGPLTPGSFALALRPEAYDRWTFARGTEDPDRAVPAILDAGATDDLGVIELDCGPTVRVEPEIASQEPVPDLRDASLEAVVRPAAESPDPKPAAPRTSAMPESSKTGKADRTAPTPPRQEAHRGFIRLRGVPEGSVDVELTIRHPYFVPGTIVVKKSGLALERGRETPARVEVVRIGGAVQFDPALGAAFARLTPAVTGDSAARPIAELLALDDKARAIGVVPGRYRVELVADAAGARTLATWQEVVVEAGKTVRPR
jgi:hypothetical protein